MAEGRKPLPTDPETLVMIRRPLERYKAKKDVAAQNPSDMNKPASMDQAAMEKATLKMTPAQRQAFRNGTPEEKIATLEAMPADEQYDVLEAIGGLPSAKLMFARSSRNLARKVEKLNGPQFVVNQDLFANKLYRAVYSNRQLQEVLTDFWYNHFNVFLDKGADPGTSLPHTSCDAIRPNVYGKVQRFIVGHGQEPGDALLSG